MTTTEIALRCTGLIPKHLLEADFEEIVHEIIWSNEIVYERMKYFEANYALWKYPLDNLYQQEKDK